MHLDQPDGRRERGRATRSKIAQAAADMFAESGFVASSVAAIASRADVSEQAIYYNFGNKETVASAAIDVVVAGDDDPVPTLERAWFLEAIEEPDARKQLGLQVSGAAEILQRSARLLEVIRGASVGNEALELLCRTNIEQRRAVQDRFVTALEAKADLRTGLTHHRAVDICTLMLSPESYLLLTRELSWGVPQWVTWTTETLIAHLIDCESGLLPLDSAASRP